MCDYKIYTMITVKNIHKQFGNTPVLRGVDLTINKGQSATIIGRSGCGKSILIKTICSLLKPDKGEVYIDGAEITRLKEKDLFPVRKKIGYVFQGAALFDSLTVAQNVGLYLHEHGVMKKDRIDAKVTQCLNRVGLYEVEDQYPSELSGGMQKRVAIARAIAADPQYLIYDEPTTGLDPIMSDVINQLISQLQREMSLTSIVVTHDMHSAFQISDSISMLFQGRIIFSGNVDDIKACDDPTVRQFIEGTSKGPIGMREK